MTVDIVGDLISKPYVDDHDQPDAPIRRRRSQQDGWRSFRVPAGARYASPGTIRRRRRRVVGVVLPRRRRDRRRARARDRRRTRRRSRATSRSPTCSRAWARHPRTATTGSRPRRARRSTGIDVDCVAIPDAAMTLAIVALFARGPTTLTGIASWRVKETDRIAAMATELAKLGATVEAGADRLRSRAAVRRLQPGDDRHLRRPPDGDVLLARGARRRGDPHQRSRLRAQDVPRLLRRVRSHRARRAPPGRAKARITPPRGTWGQSRAPLPPLALAFPQAGEATRRGAPSRRGGKGLRERNRGAHEALVPVIAIDGPAASGKGTIAAGVARALGFHLLDSGVALPAGRAKGAGGRRFRLDDERALAAVGAALDVTFAEGRDPPRRPRRHRGDPRARR